MYLSTNNLSSLISLLTLRQKDDTKEILRHLNSGRIEDSLFSATQQDRWLRRNIMRNRTTGYCYEILVEWEYIYFSK